MAMGQGKCEECGKPTKMRDDGTAWRKCFECNQKDREAKTAKQETLPARSAQEQIADIGTTFQMSVGQAYSAFEEMEQMMERAYGKTPVIPPEFKAARIWEAAINLNQQYWSNQRTPGGVK